MPGACFSEQNLMSHLVLRTSKPAWTQSIQGSNSRQPRTDSFNRSSLALDWDEASLPVNLPVPLEMPKRNVQIGAVNDRLIWKGLDLDVHERNRSSGATAFVIHCLILILILRLGMAAHTKVAQAENTVVTPLHFTLYAPPPMVMPVAKAASGGGGAHHLVQPVKVHPPVFARTPVFAPQILRVEQPKLAVEPAATWKIPENNNQPSLAVAQSPRIALASLGSGGGSGFGSGLGGGIGSGNTSGVGNGLMSVGGGVSAPQVIHSVDPEFTEDARQANFQGTASIQLIVDSQGYPQDIRIVRHLGMGLDQKAVDAVRQYRFRPAVYQGHPVAVRMQIEVDFRLH
jgi:periplasmic protein TonB